MMPIPIRKTCLRVMSSLAILIAMMMIMIMKALLKPHIPNHHEMHVSSGVKVRFVHLTNCYAILFGRRSGRKKACDHYKDPKIEGAKAGTKG